MFEKVVTILLPIFAIMGLGYLSGRLELIGKNSAVILNRFVTHISLPLLLFGALASQPIDEIFNLPFIVSFGAAVLVCFLLPWVLLRDKSDMSKRAIRGLGASFANVGFVGLPLLTPMVGTLALPALGVSNLIVLTAMAVTVLLLELARNDTGNLGPAIRTALVHTFKNPIIFSLVAGTAFSISGLSLPGWIDRTTQIVGAATPPVALFAMGEALVAARLTNLGEIGVLAAVKLIVMPLIVLGILQLFPQVDPKWAVSAVMLAALSTAVLEYIVATEYREDVQEASGLVLLTTILSALTLPVFVIWSLHIWPLP
ncbi:AEC family transporter [Hoeflea sp. TYP-13]|uniref:AEC family transporter n=1 Tax=Hoeflea sp. TYP-13 TaxID=3230023 RepID=UPI0034C624ED